jgi:TolA-binding protein
LKAVQQRGLRINVVWVLQLTRFWCFDTVAVRTKEAEMSRDSDDLTTQPTATALMERVQQVEVRLSQEIDSLAARMESQTARLEGQITRLEGQISSSRDEIVNSFQDQISSLREEILKGFNKLSNKVMTLNEDTLDVRTNQREILKRLDDLEVTVKAS